MLRVHVAEVYLACVEGVDNAITGRSVHKGPFAVRSVAIAEIMVRGFRFRELDVLRLAVMEDDQRRALQRIRGERRMDPQDLLAFANEFVRFNMLYLDRVQNDDAFATSKLLGRKEGVLTGISSGAALWTAIELAKREEYAGRTIVALLPDSGDRYYSTPLFAE